MQIQPPITIEINPSRLKGLLHPISHAGNCSHLFELHVQVRPTDPMIQCIFFGICLGRMVMAEIHVQDTILVVIGHSSSIRSLHLKPLQASRTWHFNQVAIGHSRVEFVARQALRNEQILITIVVEISP